MKLIEVSGTEWEYLEGKMMNLKHILRPGVLEVCAGA
jgi:hypothetical protein